MAAQPVCSFAIERGEPTSRKRPRADDRGIRPDRTSPGNTGPGNTAPDRTDNTAPNAAPDHHPDLVGQLASIALSKHPSFNPITMQSLQILKQLRAALDRETAHPGIEAYTDIELEQLRNEIRALDRFNRRIEAVICRRELACFENDIADDIAADPGFKMLFGGDR